jgi:hypothetical protein
VYNPQTLGRLFNVSDWLNHKLATSRGRDTVIEGTARSHKKQRDSGDREKTCFSLFSSAGIFRYEDFLKNPGAGKKRQKVKNKPIWRQAKTVF